MKKVYVNKNIVKNIASGHPWIFSGGINKLDEDLENGEICEAFYEDTYLGTGYYNANSQISVRILTRISQSIDVSFFEKRFEILKKEKEQFLLFTNSYRLVFGESDNLPGLVVDVYDKVVVLQIHSLGMEKLKREITDALVKVLKPFMIYEKSDSPSRLNEGMPKESSGILYGNLISIVEIKENGYKFSVDVVNGQKTGFFIDQRENRLCLHKYSMNKKVLNCFSYTGGFSVYAAKTAKTVTSVDISKSAIENAKNNFKINCLDTEKNFFIVDDVFEYLNKIKSEEFDLIVLDPPSFAKNRSQIKNAIKAYTTINTKALEKLPDYGILVSSSCTTHIDEQTFIKILRQSAINSKCQLRILESRIQPQDHGYNLAFPEGRYLKFFVMQKLPVL